MLKLLILILSIITLSACSSDNVLVRKKHSQSETTSLKTNTSKKYQQIIKQNLENIYKEWKGTKYRLGGTSKKGIDCSAFTKTIFSSFHVHIPRSTTGQKKIGKKIKQSNLKIGDLIFFRKNRHVGIYIGNRQFMHSSSSQGVTISSLDNLYWKRTYTQSRRILKSY